SSCYVERRDKLARGGALDGAGKRAAFALFYGPQHFLITREIMRAIGPAPHTRVIDLGCGTGSAGSAVALETGGAVIEGCDLHPWAVREANWTYDMFGLRGRATIANIVKARIDAASGALVLAAYAVNELAAEARGPLLDRLKAAHIRGASILVIEPIGRRTNLWWPGWTEAFTAAGGRDDDWRFRVPLPPRQRLLAKGAGLDPQELTARSLYLPGTLSLSE
ncbi:MAG: class I SAM-dependent methyltransferase, partial [Acidobacteria bacterium]|nr:class I SAM-dependent methyltransferase [Acidobacteriota bacterium]